MSQETTPQEHVTPSDGESPSAPVAIQVVAFLFILVGVLAVTDTVLSMLKARGHLNFGILGIFIGRGILRRSEGWRALGVALCLIGALLGTIGLLGGLVIQYFRGTRFVTDSSVLEILALVVTVAAIFWCYRVLHGAVTRKWCAERYVPGPPRRRFQFTLRTMLLATLVCSFVFAQIAADKELIYRPLSSANTMIPGVNGTNTEVTYVSRSHRFLDRPPRLDGVLFYNYTGTSTASRGMGIDASDRRFKSFGLGDISLRLPDDFQLHEVTDGKHITSDRRVSYEELEAFLNSKPEQYTIEALLEFVDARGTER